MVKGTREGGQKGQGRARERGAGGKSRRKEGERGAGGRDTGEYEKYGRERGNEVGGWKFERGKGERLRWGGIK